ncbi:MAG: hypothetical protein ACRC9O_03250 [Plesiomonas sp.]|uniref:hypothetical protein n=1 Tax=Plesiomonas sp. TaxID=2486279 RepID=UPI003F341999
MKSQEATKSQAKFDVVKAFSGMGAAVEILLKAAPNAFAHAAAPSIELQGRKRSSRKVA